MRARYARWIYSAILYLAVPFVLLSLLRQSRNNKAYRSRWRERFGYVSSQQGKQPTLVHCASVGEFLAAKAFIQGLMDSGASVWVTCSTPTGSELIVNFLQGKGQHSYLPIDLPHVIKRFLKRVTPAKIVLMETEVWPNLVHYSAKAGIPQALVNARMSERSQQGYLKVKALFLPAWQALHLCAAQNEVQAERLLSLGVHPEAMQVTGNFKFDVQVPEQVQQQISSIKTAYGPRPIITAGSTHVGEEPIILAAFATLLASKPEALLILVPRHQERFDEVAKLIEQQGLTMVRRSAGQPVTPATQVLLADSMGELMVWYGVSSVAFVGGSLIERGGHNPLEPMAYGLPIISGPHVFNFQEVFNELDAQQAVYWVKNQDTLHDTLLKLLEHLTEAQRIGEQAQQLFARHSGATARTHALVLSLGTNER